jgi:hypothetical protein
MPVMGTCRLCLREDQELQESHWLSRKLYYRGKKRLEFINVLESGVDPQELKAHLLCVSCEQRFGRNGEDEVLRHVAPKLLDKPSHLHQRMRLALPRDEDPSAPRFCAYDFDLDTEKFAYFAVSVIWRRTIHEWAAGGTVFQRWELGDFARDMRRYLMGETPFPSNMAVIVLVCGDAESRREPGRSPRSLSTQGA